MHEDLNRQEETVLKHDDRLDKLGSRMDGADVRAGALRDRADAVVEYSN